MDDVREMVRRVVGRVLSERGAESPRPGAAVRPAGVHVDLEPARGAPRPAEPGSQPGTRPGRPVVSARCLEREGFVPPPGALLTPLAQDELWRRRGDPATGARAGGRMRVAVGADHGGFALKKAVLAWLRELGHGAVDLGTHDEHPVDYPDFARAVAEAVAEGRCDLGVCVDGAGIGSAIAANKVPGVRAACCVNEAMARNAREHNLANVLTLGGRLLDELSAQKILRAFLATPEGGERHRRRVAKIDAIEVRYARRPSAEPSQGPLR